MVDHAYWIVLAPLISSLVVFFFGRWLPLRGAPVGVLAQAYALVHSLGLFFAFLAGAASPAELSVPWFRFGIYQTELGVTVDGLFAGMCLIVTLISFLVHVYSLGYMRGDPRFKRYYAYLSFFTFAMLFLVAANNFLQIFIGWELVGVASYFLIGFWFERSSAAYAGRKAYVTNKVGDLGFLIAILMIFSLLGTLNFAQVQGRISEGLISRGVCTVIALLLFCGAAAKSAQVPLHVWLPDAMEGPTPVSALIHAATMVAAGVYMIARTYFIFQHGGLSLEIIAWIGGLTAFLAATMALVATDIKRVLAFSTISQLGYMMLALGVGGREAAVFHLFTHACFKALLFLGAGAVIHATGTNDIREMGGLSKKMLGTFWTFSFGWVAICGVWPFAGFFSKDAILEAAHVSGHHALFWIGVFTALLTSFYMTRLYILVFVNDHKNIDIYNHAHEAPLSMLLPMMVLALLSLGAGLFFQYGMDFAAFLGAAKAPAEQAAAAGPAWFVPVWSSIASLGGIALAILFYSRRAFSAEALARAFQPVYNALEHRYWFDELYLYGFVVPADSLARFLSFFDSRILDRTGGVSLVNLFGISADRVGAVFRRAQTGMVQNYILFSVFGFGLLVVWRLGFLHF